MKSRIVEYSLSNTSGVSAVYARGIHNCFARHSHESYIIGIVLNGRRITVSGDVEEVTGKGELFRLKPYQEHSCRFEGDDGCDYFALAVSNHRAKDICGDVQEGVASEGKSLPVEELTLEFDSRIDGEVGSWSVLEIINFLLMQLSPVLQDADSVPELLSKGMGFINNNYSLKISLEDIATYSCMSKYNFQRLFVKHYGMSPAALIDKKRVSEAIRRIHAGESPSSVALYCGFSDQSHLCRVIRKVTGVSVSNYSQVAL